LGIGEELGGGGTVSFVTARVLPPADFTFADRRVVPYLTIKINNQHA